VIRTRLLATAFILNSGDLLLMRRSHDAKLLPGMWAPVGGHIEADELETPQVACEREVSEETGLSGSDISDLSLRYIVHRIRHDEVRIQFIYVGSSAKRDLGSTDEGELHWVPLAVAPSLDVSATTRFTIEHYVKTGSRTTALYVGSVSGQEGNPVINWSVLSDWE